MCSYELCAGLIDIENRSKEQTVVDEIREELGYEVPISDLRFIIRSMVCVFVPSRCGERRNDRLSRVYVLRGGDPGAESSSGEDFGR